MSSCPICGEEFASEHGVKVHAGRSHDKSLAGQTVKCDTCGEEIKRQPHEIDEYEKHFWSDECETEWRKQRYSGKKNPLAKESITIDCEWCGDEFSVPPHKEDTARFCSIDCKGKFQSEVLSGPNSHAWEGGPEIGTCKLCGEQFEYYSSESEVRKYCSYDCLGSAREETMQGEQNPSWKGGKETVKCETCGEDFKVYPSVSESSRFCSYECVGRAHQRKRSGENSPRWQGGYEPYYGPNWRKQRRKRLRLDQARCQDCGITDAQSLKRHGSSLEIHHKIPFRKFAEGEDTDYTSANDIENLITLCKSCHSQRRTSNTDTNTHV